MPMRFDNGAATLLRRHLHDLHFYFNGYGAGLIETSITDEHVTAPSLNVAGQGLGDLLGQ